MSATSQPSGLARLWTNYLSCLQAAPIPTKTLTMASLSALGNIISQVTNNPVDPKTGKKEIDWSRIRGFMIASATLAPVAHHWLAYVDKLSKNIFVKTFYDRFVFGPPFNAAFLFLATVFQGKPVSDAIELFRNGTFLVALKANLKMWPIVQLFNFQFVPPHLRLPFINVFALIWMTLLSAILGKPKQSEKKKEE